MCKILNILIIQQNMSASTKIEDLPDNGIEDEEYSDEDQGLSSNKIFNEITNLDIEKGEDLDVIDSFVEEDNNNFSYLKDTVIVFILIFTGIFFYKDIVKILVKLPLFNVINSGNQVPFMIFVSTIFSLVFLGNKYFLD